MVLTFSHLLSLSDVLRRDLELLCLSPDLLPQPLQGDPLPVWHLQQLVHLRVGEGGRVRVRGLPGQGGEGLSVLRNESR